MHRHAPGVSKPRWRNSYPSSEYSYNFFASLLLQYIIHSSASSNCILQHINVGFPLWQPITWLAFSFITEITFISPAISPNHLDSNGKTIPQPKLQKHAVVRVGGSTTLSQGGRAHLWGQWPFWSYQAKREVCWSFLTLCRSGLSRGRTEDQPCLQKDYSPRSAPAGLSGLIIYPLALPTAQRLQ